MPRSIRNKRKVKDTDKVITIGQYIDKKEAFHNAPGRITPEGEMKVLWEGEWLTNKDFLALKTSPTNINFTLNKNNVDRTRQYLL